MTKKMKINGPIISNADLWFYEWLEMDGTAPRSIIDQLPDNGEDVEITINSYGGLVDQGNEIYTALKNYPGKVVVNVVMAGSAASIIAMSADVVKISPVGRIMIHNVAAGVGGDYHDMDKMSEILRKANESLANAYVLKTGKPREEILDLMDKETWLTADEAKEQGFADEILFQEEQVSLVASFGHDIMPKKVIDELKKLKIENETMKQKIKNIEEEKPVNESPFKRFLF